MISLEQFRNRVSKISLEEVQEAKDFLFWELYNSFQIFDFDELTLEIIEEKKLSFGFLYKTLLTVEQFLEGEKVAEELKNKLDEHLSKQE